VPLDLEHDDFSGQVMIAMGWLNPSLRQGQCPHNRNFCNSIYSQAQTVWRILLYLQQNYLLNSLVTYFYLLYLLNVVHWTWCFTGELFFYHIAYEVFAYCTSIVAQTPNGICRLTNIRIIYNMLIGNSCSWRHPEISPVSPSPAQQSVPQTSSLLIVLFG